MSVLTLKPGLLVSLSARMAGGITYQRKDLDKKTETDGPKVEKWETTKVIADPEEYERGNKVRGKCRSLIASECTYSTFGLLCPTDKEKALDDAIKESRRLAETFNASARTVQISVYVMKGRIAETDQEAAKGIADELKGLLDDMRDGVLAGDVKRVRDAADTAKQLGRMLDDTAAKRVAAAVEEARFFAKEITKRVKEEADTVADYVQEIKLNALAESRFAFLDMDEVGEAPKIDAAPRAVDFEEDGQAVMKSLLSDNDNEPDMNAAPAAEAAARALDL